MIWMYDTDYENFFFIVVQHATQEWRQGKSLEGQRNLGGPGGRAPWWGSGGKAPWSWSLITAKIVKEALPEHIFPRWRWQKS